MRSFLFFCLKFFLVSIAAIFVLIVGLGLYLYVYYADQPYYKPLPPSWDLDYNYSRYLMTKDDEFDSVVGDNSADTVDFLSVYKVFTNNPEWYSLKEVRKKLYNLKEVRNRERFVSMSGRLLTKEFILAARERLRVEDRFDALKGCRSDNSKNLELDKFYVVMVNDTSNRAGYFSMILCNSQGKQYLQIRVPDKNGSGTTVYYNDSLFPLFEPFLD